MTRWDPLGAAAVARRGAWLVRHCQHRVEPGVARHAVEPGQSSAHGWDRCAPAQRPILAARGRPGCSIPA